MRIFSSKWQESRFSATGGNTLHPIGRMLRSKHLLEPMTIEEVEARELLLIEKEKPRGFARMPFGWRNCEWEHFKAETNPEKIWSFRLVDSDNEYRTEFWEGYVERRWFGWGGLIVTDHWAEFPLRVDDDDEEPEPELQDEPESFEVPAFLKRAAD